MGKPMVRNLLKGGYSGTVHDINAAAVAELTSAGATAGGSSLNTPRSPT
jgi:3-hydroxyisobutyrate dehydrogenase-like beta-hydroxyacid dehydrogenase